MNMKKTFAIAFASLAIVSCSDDKAGNFTLKGSMSRTQLAAVDASSLQVKVYKFAVSTNADCSNPTTVYTNANPTYTEMSGAGKFGSGDLADGTYPCVIIEMSDNIKFTPATSEGPCTAGTEYTIDVCRSDNGDSSKLIDGTTVTCTGSDNGTTQVLGDDKVALYITTAKSAETGLVRANQEDGSTFLPPDVGATTTNNGVNLGTALVVSGAATGYFIVDPSSKVNAEGNTALCGMMPPYFGFSTPK